MQACTQSWIFMHDLDRPARSSVAGRVAPVQSPCHPPTASTPSLGSRPRKCAEHTIPSVFQHLQLGPVAGRVFVTYLTIYLSTKRLGANAISLISSASPFRCPSSSRAFIHVPRTYRHHIVNRAALIIPSRPPSVWLRKKKR